jgi:hypothetical protein
MRRGHAMTWREWLWSFLPDKCQGHSCMRRGVRGNENVMPNGVILCDDCSVYWRAARVHEKMMEDFKNRRHS